MEKDNSWYKNKICYKNTIYYNYKNDKSNWDKCGEIFFFEMLEEFGGSVGILVKNNDGSKMNIFAQSLTGEFTLEGIDTKKVIFLELKAQILLKK